MITTRALSAISHCVCRRNLFPLQWRCTSWVFSRSLGGWLVKKFTKLNWVENEVYSVCGVDAVGHSLQLEWKSKQLYIYIYLLLSHTLSHADWVSNRFSSKTSFSGFNYFDIMRRLVDVLTILIKFVMLKWKDCEIENNLDSMGLLVACVL